MLLIENNVSLVNFCLAVITAHIILTQGYTDAPSRVVRSPFPVEPESGERPFVGMAKL